MACRLEVGQRRAAARALPPAAAIAKIERFTDAIGNLPEAVNALQYRPVQNRSQSGEVAPQAAPDLILNLHARHGSEAASRRQHDLPVPALDVLRGLARINGCPWAFTTTGKAALTYRPVYIHFGEAARAAGLADVRLHDLRRSVMTRAAAAGVGTHVLRDLLGHKTTAMADRYVRAVGSPVRDAREAVAAEMARAMATGQE